MNNPWLISLTSKSNSVNQLVCFPYACGNGSMYYRFSQALETDIEVLAAVLPGHGGDGVVPKTIEAFAEPFIQLLQDTSKPTYLLGYSFGGFIAYEIAKKLVHTGKVAGLLLFSCPSPGVKREMDFILNAEDAALYEYTLESYQFDLNILTDSERSAYYHLLRNDTAAMKAYSFPNIALKIPSLVALGALEEEKELVERTGEWDRYLHNPIHEQLPGGHMLIKTHWEIMAKTADRFLQRQEAL